MLPSSSLVHCFVKVTLEFVISCFAVESQRVIFSCKGMWLTCRLQFPPLLTKWYNQVSSTMRAWYSVNSSQPCAVGSDFISPWFASFVAGTWDTVICGSNQSGGCGFQFSLILTEPSSFLYFFIIQHWTLFTQLWPGDRKEQCGHAPKLPFLIPSSSWQTIWCMGKCNFLHGFHWPCWRD